MIQKLTKRSSALEYRPAIDGLRAIAVLSVFIFHLNHHWLPGGFVGVDVFFVISGYLITSIINKECQRGSFSLKRFYQRRIARIFPAFFTVALATLVGACFIYTSQDIYLIGAHFVDAALCIENIKLVVQEGNYFQTLSDAQPFTHYWSLSVEEQFYIFFPLLFLILFKFYRNRLVLVLGIFCAGSLLASIVMTYLKPIWAFYLLPTRAYELFVGSILGVITDHLEGTARSKTLSALSLGLIGMSFWVIKEGSDFPGYWALIPVIGTAGLLILGPAGPSKKLLALDPLVAVGRISYSLYLWHWPIFSLIDYKLYLVSDYVRLPLKISLSFFAAVLSFWVIENPARIFFNRREKMPLAFAAMFVAITICVSLGIAVRKSNVVTVKMEDVAKGGLVFDSKTNKKSVILMGDSNGSMYGNVMREICLNLSYKLVVISVDGGDPLPSYDINSGQLWLDSLAVVRREKPDYLIIACNWMDQLKTDKRRLALAVAVLKPLVGQLVILNQPPLLPENANRDSIREGVRPPFYEDESIHRQRIKSNNYLGSFSDGNCSVVDISSHFLKPNGEIILFDEEGREFYYDYDHLSAHGANFVRSVLEEAIKIPKSN